MPDAAQAVRMPLLEFYTTAGCHLCEQAEALLAALAQIHKITVVEVEISSDVSLVERYGIRIPVVRNAATGAELGWPFQLEQLQRLIV